MSVSDGEQAARSVALEQAYVHEVYEQCAEKTAQSRHWPSIYKFLEELEPGALVCDIGCGNGKYLSVNNNIFKVGADRCKRLTDIAREKEKEVLVCDNLALPFRDESFDAVLSIAVVHHFATTERRVNALKELARVMRIGGKLVISVWAMEQRHRKFESQDVLVPWPKAYCLNSTCNGATCGMPCSNQMRRDHQSSQKCVLNSKRVDRRKYRSKGYWVDPSFSSSPSTSSLSSPNETCYSFFRRALQKLAGNKRGSSEHRPWFLEGFHNSSCENRGHHCEHDDCGDLDDTPIELRRLEDENVVISNKTCDTLSMKSKSLGDMLEIQRMELVRSRSSIPGLCSTFNSEFYLDQQSATPTLGLHKPRLVKQKTTLVDDTCLEVLEDTAIRELIKDLPDFQTDAAQSLSAKRANIHKQSSMNEEFMSMERLVERDHVRRNIMKQASLNEEIICPHRTFENFKDSLSSANATRRFQLLKSGLTNRLKQSTTSMEKVAGMSIKNGFVKILQGWTSSDSNPECMDEAAKAAEIIKNKINEKNVQLAAKKDPEIIERRLSKEDGSDSSKDSSLQSDTSVDSEDSFASVIYVPKQEIPTLIDVPSGYQLRTTSAPPSPRVKHPPELHGPRMKLISISPLLKQFPATSKSLPPPSPPGLSPKTISLYNSRPFFGPNYKNNQVLAHTFDKIISTKKCTDSYSLVSEKSIEKPTEIEANTKQEIKTPEKEERKVVQMVDEDVKKEEKSLEIDQVDSREEEIPKKNKKLAACRGYRSMTNTVDIDDVSITEDSEPLLSTAELPERSSSESINDDSRKSRLNQIKELLKQKPGFATRSTKPSFPLVRRASTATAGRTENVARTLPRLLSLELFNPETDDLDSDSSGVSSPESAGSVISVISDERFILKKKSDKNKSHNEEAGIDDESTSPIETTVESNETNTSPETSINSSQTDRHLGATAGVTSSLENAVDHMIRIPSKSQDSQRPEESSDSEIFRSMTGSKIEKVKNYLEEFGKIPPEDHTWNEECRQHLIDFTEKLSENLIQDIDQYCEKSRLEISGDFGEIRKKSETSTCQSNSSYRRDCKYTELVDNTIAWLKNSTGDTDFSEYNNKMISAENQIMENGFEGDEETPLCHSNSEDTMDFVMISKTGEVEENSENITKTAFVNSLAEKSQEKSRSDKSYMRFGGSIESSDIGDSIDTSVSISDDSTNTRRLCSGSTASLGSNTLDNKSLKEKRRYQYAKKSASEEIPNERYETSKNENMSGSSSQESLASDRGGGGAITYHQYYHVFREGELDQLINKYVENLHIISSYYDHASWCIVAEKVQVWTI